MRNFIFNGYLSIAGEDGRLAVVLENIAVSTSYNDMQPMAIDIDNFQEALSSIGWRYDLINMNIFEILNPSRYIGVSEHQLSHFEETIYFSGKALQFTGFHDKLNRPVFECHVMDGATVGFCSKTGQWGLKYPKRDNYVPLHSRVNDFFIERYDLPLTKPLYHEKSK